MNVFYFLRTNDRSLSVHPSCVELKKNNLPATRECESEVLRATDNDDARCSSDRKIVDLLE